MAKKAIFSEGTLGFPAILSIFLWKSTFLLKTRCFLKRSPKTCPETTHEFFLTFHAIFKEHNWLPEMKKMYSECTRIDLSNDVNLVSMSQLCS
jgi:hypothetical protein